MTSTAGAHAPAVPADTAGVGGELHAASRGTVITRGAAAVAADMSGGINDASDQVLRGADAHGEEVGVASGDPDGAVYGKKDALDDEMDQASGDAAPASVPSRDTDGGVDAVIAAAGAMDHSGLEAVGTGDDSDASDGDMDDFVAADAAAVGSAADVGPDRAGAEGRASVDSLPARSAAARATSLLVPAPPAVTAPGAAAPPAVGVELPAAAPAVAVPVPALFAASLAPPSAREQDVSDETTPTASAVEAVPLASPEIVATVTPDGTASGEPLAGGVLARPPPSSTLLVPGGHAAVPVTAGIPPRGSTRPVYGGRGARGRGPGASAVVQGREAPRDGAAPTGVAGGADRRYPSLSSAGGSPVLETTQLSQSGGFVPGDGVGSDMTDAVPPATGTSAAGGNRALQSGRQGRGPGRPRNGGAVGNDARPMSEAEDAVVPVAAQQPRTGVYELKQATRSSIATLLRTLFVVRNVSDRSIMPFLGVAYYLMSFSFLVGIATPDDRCEFFDELSEAFEQPVSMKHFMEEAFRCGPGGLHVGGRTKCEKHVFGQPDDFRGDILRDRLNPTNAKVQWLSRRLCLRTSVDVQPGARSTGGGLSVEDRAAIAAALTREAVRIGLSQRGCSIKFAGHGGADNAPLSLAFHWDATPLWRADSLESGLVADMQGILLRGMPGLHADRDPSKVVKAKAVVQQRGVKRKEMGNELVGADRKKKRKGQEQPGRLEADVSPCANCGHVVKGDASGAVQVVSTDLEQWSADVLQSERLPRGGHVLAISLPMHMDCGPTGRVHVSAQMQKTSSVQGPPYRYTVVVEPSSRPPQQVVAVQDASFVTVEGRTVPTSALSQDILRSVSVHLSRRRPSPAAPSSAADGPAEAVATPQGGVQLSVCSVPRPTPLLHRFEFASQYELSCQAELVERSPGRITMLYEGIAPLPLHGISTL